jgi:NCAIR mutase (PurE)-related protein
MNLQDRSIEKILTNVQNKTLGIQEAKAMLQGFDDLGFAKLDVSRQKRTGFPEVVFGEGKTVHQIIEIVKHLKERIDRVLVTRIDEEKADAILKELPNMEYNSTGRTLFWKMEDVPAVVYKGYIAIVCAGTSDLPVAEEAAVTAEAFGCEVVRIYDVGVAGIHRLFHHLETIRNASSSVVVAGMEGALASVVGGLVQNPIIAVPTSVGYGANFQGISALLSMLNACSPGISVVNIDNGFGAGYYATLINSKIHRESDQ